MRVWAVDYSDTSAGVYPGGSLAVCPSDTIRSLHVLALGRGYSPGMRTHFLWRLNRRNVGQTVLVTHEVGPSKTADVESQLRLRPPIAAGDPQAWSVTLRVGNRTVASSTISIVTQGCELGSLGDGSKGADPAAPPSNIGF